MPLQWDLFWGFTASPLAACVLLLCFCWSQGVPLVLRLPLSLCDNPTAPDCRACLRFILSAHD